MENGERGRNRVQDVCQKFRILEDQTVAHVLQEQEIQQHLAANEQKSRRVRDNLRAARSLQDEEDEWSRQLTRRLRKQIEDMESDRSRIVQDDNGHRQSKSKEASSELLWFAREAARPDEEEEELATEKSDEGIRGSRARSRKPYIGRATEDAAGWDGDGSRREGVHHSEDSGWDLEVGEAAIASGSGQAKAITQLATEHLGRYQSPAHGLRRVKETEEIPRAFSARSEDQLERDRTRPCVTERTQRAVNGIERDVWKRQCRSDWSYTEDSEYLAPKPTMAGGGSRYHVEGRADSSRALPDSSRSAAIAHPAFTNGKDLDIPRRCASDSESQPRPRKHKRDGEGVRSQARSEVSHRPVRVRHNRKVLSPQNSQRGYHPETIRHKHRSQGHHRPRGEPQTDRHSELGLKQRDKDRRHPLDPKEWLKQEDRWKEENGHHPLAVKEKEKQAPQPLVVNPKHAPRPLAVGEKQAHRPLVGNQQHAPHPLAVGGKQAHRPLVGNQQHAPHPLAVGEKQAHRPLVGNQQHAPRPLAVGEKLVHSPVRTKVKEKQVHFLLDPVERVKPAHCPLTNKEKQVLYPLDLKGKEVHSPLASKQKRVHFPLAVEEHVQNPLVVKEKDVQSPLAGKEKKNPAHFPLAVKVNRIQYRMGNKDTETIIDYLSDKRKENDSSSPKHVSQLPPARREDGCPEKDRGKPVEPTSDKARLLPAQPAGDIRENHTQPVRLLHAEKDPARDPSSNRPAASTARTGGSRWRGEPSQRATHEPKAAGQGQARSQWREPHHVRAHGDNTSDRPGGSKADRSNTPSPLNRQQNQPRAGEQRASETRKESPNGRSRTPNNGVTVPTWCTDETLKDLQAMELRKAQMRKAKADKKLAQLAQDEEFALELLRKELTTLRMSEGRKEPSLSQTGENSVARGPEECLRSSSPQSLNVDWPEQEKAPKPAYF